MKYKLVLLGLCIVILSNFVSALPLVYEDEFQNITSWDQIGSDNWTVNSGIIECSSSGNGCALQKILSSNLTNWSVQTRISIDHFAIVSLGQNISTQTGANAREHPVDDGYGARLPFNNDPDFYQLYEFEDIAGGTLLASNNPDNVYDSKFFVLSINKTGNNISIYRNGSFVTSALDSTYTNLFDTIGLSGLQSGSTNPTKIDWIKIYGEAIAENFTITAKDMFDDSTITNFTANITGDVFYSTNNGIIVTGLIRNNASTHNITITSNQSGGYFNKTYVNYNISNNLEAQIFQAEILFNATDVLGNLITGGNFTSGTKTQNPIYFSAGKHNVTFSKIGVQNTTQEFTIVALENGTRTIENVSTNTLNITAQTITGTPINNFSINAIGLNISLNYTVNTTNGYIELAVLNNSLFNVTIDAPTYAINTTLIVVDEILENYTFVLQQTNSINFTFIDDIDLNIVNDRTITMELISDSFSNNYSTTTGQMFLSLLSPETYTIRYSATGYFENFYLFSLENRSTNELTLYMTNSTVAQEVTATVIDQGNNLIEGAIIKVLRFDVTTNSFYTDQIVETNFEGETILNLILNEEFYKFIIEYPSGTVVKTTSKTKIFGTTLEFQIVLGDLIAETFFNSEGVNYNIQFNNATNNFIYTYSDSSNTVSQGCLEIFVVTGLSSTAYNSSCVASSSGVITLGVQNTSGTTYKANANVYFGSDKYFLDSLFKTFKQTGNTGILGIFIVALLTIEFAFIGIFSGAVAAVLTPLPILFSSFMGIIDIEPSIALGFEVLGIFVAYMLSRR